MNPRGSPPGVFPCTCQGFLYAGEGFAGLRGNPDDARLMASPESPGAWPFLGSTETNNMITEAIRVLLVDDHSVVRAGLKSVLSATPDITVVGEANNGREAIAAAEQLKPDVVVMDLSMPDVDGIVATKEIIANGNT